MSNEYVSKVYEHINKVKENYKLLTGNVLYGHDETSIYLIERPSRNTSEAERLLYHQNNNQHHWQYWVLITDEGDLRPLDMPDCYVAEMVCDWAAKLNNDGNKLILYWCDLRKKIISTANTDKLISKYVDKLSKLLIKN